MSLKEKIDDFFFKQTRIGIGGEPFTIVKFRTMKRGREQEYSELVNSKGTEFGHIIDDPRITRTGRLMRATRFDELPQIFYNYLRGHMKLIGPRALTPEDFEARPNDVKEGRKAMKPGMVPNVLADFFKIKSGEMDIIESERRYLERYFHSSKETDPEYFRRTVYNGFKLAGNWLYSSAGMFSFG